MSSMVSMCFVQRRSLARPSLVYIVTALLKLGWSESEGKEVSDNWARVARFKVQASWLAARLGIYVESLQTEVCVSNELLVVARAISLTCSRSSFK